MTPVSPTPPPDAEPLEFGELVCFDCGVAANELQLVKVRTTRLDVPFPRQGSKIRSEFSMPCGHLVAGWRTYDEEDGWPKQWSYTRLDWVPWDERTKR